MKAIFDNVSYDCSKTVTKTYSTSFSLATKMLSKSIRQDIYNIYGFVRFADEIVDSFHDFDKKELFQKFEQDLEHALKNRISLNPILNAFQHTFHHYNIDKSLVNSFMNSMRMDLHKSNYLTEEEYKAYIYGSADVVGLMCLKVFVNGDEDRYNELKDTAMSLGSAFQKVNFLRDLNEDFENLNRSYFPNINPNQISELDKEQVILDIKRDFKEAHKGIIKLPNEAKLAVYVAYKYYSNLLNKIEKTPSYALKEKRIRVSNPRKMCLLVESYFNFKMNLV